MAKAQRLLAIDTSGSPGFAVVDFTSKGEFKLVSVNSLKTDNSLTDAQRYAAIGAMLTLTLFHYAPFDYVTREHFTKGRDKRATQVVFGAWAAVDAALSTFGYAIDTEDEIVASTVKLTAAGAGNASKADVEKAMMKAYQLPETFKFASDDESDAAAIAYTFMKKRGFIK